MRDLGLRELASNSLATPFKRWPVFLACALTALVVGCILLGVHIGTLFLGSGDTRDFIDRLRYLKIAPHVLAAIIVFHWCWMTALLHHSRRHIITFPLYGNFWKSSVTAIFILFWLLMIWIANRMLASLLASVIQMLPQDAMLPAYKGASYLLVFVTSWLAIWGVLHLMLRQTFIIADRRQRDLSSTSRLARQAQRHLLILSLVLAGLHLAYQVVVSLIYQAVYGTGLRVNVGDVIVLPLFSVTTVLGLILLAAVGAGLASVYRHLAQHETNPSIDVF